MPPVSERFLWCQGERPASVSTPRRHRQPLDDRDRREKARTASSPPIMVQWRGQPTHLTPLGARRRSVLRWTNVSTAAPHFSAANIGPMSLRVASRNSTRPPSGTPPPPIGGELLELVRSVAVAREAGRGYYPYFGALRSTLQLGHAHRGVHRTELRAVR
jgi:hypothetical protein